MTSAEDYASITDNVFLVDSSRRQRRFSCARAFRVFGFAAAIVIGLSSCSILGGSTVNEQQTNLANQRKAALTFASNRPGLEQIRFTSEGRSVGLGGTLWGAGAIVTIGGKEYEESIGFERGTTFGEPMPSLPPQSSRGPVTVIYSDGRSEVLR